MPKDFQGHDLHPSLEVSLGNLDGPSLLYAQGYDGPVPAVGDYLWTHVYGRDIGYHGRPDEEWPADPGDRLLLRSRVTRRTFTIQKTPQAWEPRCVTIQLVAEWALTAPGDPPEEKKPDA